MLHKNIIKLAALLWCVLTVASCTNEDFDKGSSGPDVPKGLPVTLKLNIGTPEVPVVETKALDNGNKFGSINNLAVLVYDENGANPVVTYVPGNGGTEVTDIKFQAKTGKYKIYVLTNVGSKEVAEAYTTETALLAAQFESATPGGGEMMLGFVSNNSYEDSKNRYDSRQNNVIEITSDGDYYAKVVPPYSKITFKVQNEIGTDFKEKVSLSINKISVKNLPTMYSYLPKKITDVQLTQGEQLLKGDASELASSYDFYMYENIQGIINGGNTNPIKKSPLEGDLAPERDTPWEYERWNQRWQGKTPCSYIELEGQYAIWKAEDKVGSGKIHYRFFLGENSFNNFDIKRNYHYVVTLAFTGLAGYNELQYEWRVNAKLNEMTILPEGTLEIDGSPDYWFPFTIINGSGQDVRITTNQDLSQMKLQYLVPAGPGYSAYWSNASQIDGVGPHSFQEYHVSVNELGIIGAASFQPNSGKEDPNENVFRDTDGNFYKSVDDNLTYRDLVCQGNIFVPRKYTIHTNPSSEYTIKVYPLLCISETTSTANTATVYAQRFDRNEGLVTENEMKKICTGSNGGGNLYVWPPRKSDLEKMVKLETHAPFVPKENERPYWTTEGVFYWNTATKTVTKAAGETKGYVRCVYRTN